MPAALLSRCSDIDGTMWHVGQSTVAASATTFALSSAFSWVAPGSASNAGRAVATPLIVDDTSDRTLSAVWVNVASFTGTWGNTDGSIQIALHNGSSTGRLPGAQIYSQSLTLTAGQVGWYKLTLSTVQVLSAYTPYYIVVSDSDGGANFVTLNIAFGSISYSEGLQNTSTVGWASSATGTAVGPPPLVICRVGGVMYGGLPLTSIATTTSDTLPIGLTLQFESDTDLLGVATQTSASIWNNATVKLYRSTVLPSGSPDATWGPFNGSNLFQTDQRVVHLSPFTMLAGTLYYLIVQRGAASVAPRILTSNSSIDSDLRKLFPLQGNCRRVYKTSAGSDTWTEDAEALYNIAALVRPSAQTGGGGGGSVLGSSIIHSSGGRC